MEKFKLLFALLVSILLFSSCDDTEVEPTVDEEELTEAEIYSDFIGEYTVASVSEDGEVMDRSEFCTKSDIELAFDLDIKESGDDLVHDVSALCNDIGFSGKLDIVDNNKTILLYENNQSLPAHKLYIQNMNQTTMTAKLEANDAYDIIITFDIN